MSVTRFYSLAQLQELLAVDAARLRDFIRDGLLTAVDVRAAGSRRATYRVSQEAVDAFLAARSTQTPVKPRAKRAKYQPVILK